MAMTEADVRAWMASQGVAASVIDDEAAYIASNYADPDENPMAVLQGALGSYLQRSGSGGDRSSGGYNTNYDDPAVVTDYGTTPARSDSPAPGYDPGQKAIQQGTIVATTGSPVLTALQTANAPLIASTQMAVQQQQQQQRQSGSVLDDDDDDSTTGAGNNTYASTSPSSPLVPVALAAMLGKLLGMF